MQSVLNKERAAMVLLALFALAGGAGAATISPSISGCTGGFTIKANGEMDCSGQAITPPCVGNVVLDSKGAADCSVALLKPNCSSLTPATSSIAPGGSVTLTAICTPTPDSYTWTGGNCAGKTTKTCTVAGGQSAGATTYTVKGSNASGAGTAATATVTVTPTPTPTPTPSTLPNCNLTQMSYGSKISLDAGCDAAKYVWVGTGFSEQTKSGFIDPPTATTIYSVTGYNSAGAAGNTSSLTINVANSCTLTATPSSIVLGESAELKASCTPAATSYNWNGAVCKAGAANDTCIVTPTVAGTATYTVTGIGTNTASATKTVTVAGPSCQLTATPPAIILGDESILTASCTPAATSYNWNGAVCKAGAANDTCIVTPTAAGTATYTVTGIGTNTASATKTVTVTAPFCTLTVSPDKIGLGDTSTLKASCTPSATGYDWNGACPSGNATDTCIVTPAAIGTQTYNVTGTGSNTATSDPKTVEVVAPFCKLTAIPSTITLGSPSTLTASCSPAASGYNWNGACAAISTYALSATAAGAYTVTVASAAGMVVGDNITIVGHPGVFELTNIAANVLTFKTATTVKTESNAVVTVTKLEPCIVTPTTAGAAFYTVTGTGANTATSQATVTVTTGGACTETDVTWTRGLASYPGGTPRQTINAGESHAFKFSPWSNPGSFVAISYSNCNTDFSISANKCEWGANLVSAGCATSGINPSIAIQTSDQPRAEGSCLLTAGQTFYVNVRQPSSSATNGCKFYLWW